VSKKQVIVKGVTQKGKNRIREHGSCWNVIEDSERGFLLESLNTGYLKWVNPDFEIVE